MIEEISSEYSCDTQLYSDEAFESNVSTWPLSSNGSILLERLKFATFTHAKSDFDCITS